MNAPLARTAVTADGKDRIMPARRGILTEQDLLDVVAYLRAPVQ